MNDERRLLGDLVALSALPAVWVGAPPERVAASMSVALSRMLDAQSVDVVLGSAGGDGSPAQDDGCLRVGIGPQGARGEIRARLGRAPSERDRLVLRLVSNLADAALRNAELDHRIGIARQQLGDHERMALLGQLVSGVAHELRTPLTYAANHLYLARRGLQASGGSEPPGVGENLAQVEEAHERIRRIVGTLRRLSRPAPDARGRVRVSEAADEAIRMFRATSVGSAHVEARLDAEGWAHADRTQLQQIVLNLLQNAAEAAGPVGRILLETRDEPDAIVLLVEDDGPGVPEPLQARIFDPFFTTKPSGTGLGLAIVRRIVESHEGHIALERAQSGGARFVVRIPLAPARADDGAAEAARTGAA